MTDGKFNPIANLPPLPGQNTTEGTPSDDKVVENDQSNGKDTKPIQSNFIIPEPIVIKDTENDHTKIIQGIILVCLVGIILFGIILTIRVIPQIVGNMSTWSKSVGSLFVSNKDHATKTASTTPAATQTTNPTKLTSTSTAVSQIKTIPATKTPAKLIAEILYTNTVGHQTTIRFNIQNIGGTASGAWSFAAHLPSNTNSIYYSQPQEALSPLSGVIYTLNFTQDYDLPIKIDLFY